MERLSSSTVIHDYTVKSSGETPSSVEHIHLPSFYDGGERISAYEFIFVEKGELYVSFELLKDKKMGEGRILFLPPGYPFKIRTKTNVSLVIIRPGPGIRFINTWDIADVDKLPSAIYPFLKATSPIRDYFRFLTDMMESGLTGNNYLDLKVQEFFFLLEGYYPRRELQRFLRPLFTPSVFFAGFIWENYKKMKTVNEFASLYGCSVSCFDKKFQSVFGMPAYQWMMKRKIEALLQQIRTTNKPFSCIAREHGFLSNSQFTDFCKKHLGGAPTKIRKGIGFQLNGMDDK